MKRITKTVNDLLGIGESILKLLIAFGIPVTIFIGANIAAVYSVIQALTVIPASLHWIVVIIGFVALFPFSAAVITICLALVTILVSVVDR